MSKQRIRNRKKRIRRIKRIRRGIIVGTMFAGVAAVTFISWKTIAPETDKAAERESIIQTEQNAAVIHIETESAEETPRTYKDVDFVPLPVPMTEQDQAVIFDICQEYGVAFPLVMAIIEHESQFDRTARSQTGDSGYMQINDCNADDLAKLGFSDLYDLKQNVSAGAYILQELFAKYGGDTTFVLMAYNAGERGARKLRESGIYETEYTIEILERAEAFSSYIDNATINRTDVR